MLTVDVDGARTPIPQLAGASAADLLLLNAGDLTYAKVHLDAASAGARVLLATTTDEPVLRGWLAGTPSQPGLRSMTICDGGPCTVW